MEEARFSVFEIARWFLTKESMSPKKLQKLVYYAYAWVLALLNEDIDNIENRLFDEEIQAWVHGPVCPELYSEYKSYGWSKIEKIEERVRLDDEVEDILNQVWEVYGSFTGNELESITHQETPWVEARKGLSAFTISQNEIDDRVIFEYYNSLNQ